MNKHVYLFSLFLSSKTRSISKVSHEHYQQYMK